MSKPNIVWCRIDERLIHGQGQLWIKALNCNLVICANDETSENEFQQELMKVSIPDGIGVRFFTLEKTSRIIDKALPTQKIFLCVKTIEDVEKLINNGVQIDEINIGNVHDGEGKEKITRAIYLSKEEKNIIKKLSSKGILFNTKTSPGGFDNTKEVDILNFI